MMEGEPQGPQSGSYFEWLVTEHSRALCAGDYLLRTAADPTERDQAKASLHKAEERFRRRLKAFPAAVYTTLLVGGAMSLFSASLALGALL